METVIRHDDPVWNVTRTNTTNTMRVIIHQEHIVAVFTYQ
jgi:hypothetical protein